MLTEVATKTLESRGLNRQAT